LDAGPYVDDIYKLNRLLNGATSNSDRNDAASGYESLIPCQFCDKLISFDEVETHQVPELKILNYSIFEQLKKINRDIAEKDMMH